MTKYDHPSLMKISQKFKKPTVSIICKNCQKIFTTKDSERQFCSIRCWQEYRKGKTLEEIYGEETAWKTKQKISKTLTGRTGRISLKGRKNISNYRKGKNLFTVEQRKKISERAKGDKNPNRQFPVKLLRQQHDQEVDKQATLLRKQGYKVVVVGKWKNPLPDIIAFKDNKVIGYEITSKAFPDERKWKDNCPYDEVVWICFKKRKISGKKS